MYPRQAKLLGVFLFAVAFSLLLTACGSGGGGATLGPPPASAQTPPSSQDVMAALTSLTHMGKTPSNHVTLTAGHNAGVGYNTDARLRRVLPDGTIEGQNFSVPSGQVLIVTDVLWKVDPGAVNSGGLRLLLDIQNVANPSIRSTVFVSPGTASVTGSVSGAPNLYVGGATNALTSGFVVSSGGTLIGRLELEGFGPFGSPLNYLIVHGYLAAAS